MSEPGGPAPRVEPETSTPAVTASGERRIVRPADVAQRAAREMRAALRPFTIPNGITLLRLGFTPFFVLAIISNDFKLALAIFVAAGLSDALDGLLARWLEVRSLVGSYLDPIADKVLLVSAYVALTWPNPGAVRIPVWLTILALSRDVLIVVVALLLYLGAGIRRFPPSFWGKATTFLHILTVALVLVANVWALPDVLLLVSFYVALSFTIISGVDYVRRAAGQLESLHDGKQP